jgi:hypothetical protein
MAQYQLVMRSGPNAGKIYPLEQAELTIGRDTSNAIAINDAEVSRKHARLTLRGTEYVIEDLGSTNGTFISGQRLSAPYTLRPGDLISLGENIVLIFEAVSDPNETMIASRKAVRAAAAAVPPPAPAPAAVPPPAYSGQVPATAAPAAPSKSSSKTILLIIGGVVLLCLCIFSIYLYFAPESFWCATVPFLFPAGACP